MLLTIIGLSVVVVVLLMFFKVQLKYVNNKHIKLINTYSKLHERCERLNKDLTRKNKILRDLRKRLRLEDK